MGPRSTHWSAAPHVAFARSEAGPASNNKASKTERHEFLLVPRFAASDNSTGETDVNRNPLAFVSILALAGCTTQAGEVREVFMHDIGHLSHRWRCGDYAIDWVELSRPDSGSSDFVSELAPDTRTAQVAYILENDIEAVHSFQRANDGAFVVNATMVYHEGDCAGWFITRAEVAR